MGTFYNFLLKEMPVFNDTNKQHADKWIAQAKQHADFVSSMDLDPIHTDRLSGGYTIHFLKYPLNRSDTSPGDMFDTSKNIRANVVAGRDVIATVVFSLGEVTTGNRCAIIEIAATNPSYQGKGIMLDVYEKLLDIYGIIMSDKELTGERVAGSYNVWKRLAQRYGIYVTHLNTAPDSRELLPIKPNEMRTHMDNEEYVFVVSKEDL